MINFTVGPVQSCESVRRIGGENVPYFRTEEFSEIMIQNEHLIKKFLSAEESTRVVFVTGSGTAAMEASVMNVLNSQDKALIINGGSFGQRFVDICRIHNIPYTEIKCEIGKTIVEEDLIKYDNCDYTALLVNINETSTGVFYNPNMLSEFCRRNNMIFVVDAISSFLADELNMKSLNADIIISGSQKALACPPGISFIAMSERALERIMNNYVQSLYFDLKQSLKDSERGQTPFTPAVGILLQINRRLNEIEQKGGVTEERKRIKLLAIDFRKSIVGLPLDIFSNSLSNAVTPLKTRNCSAYDIFLRLKDEYNIWVCPNGGILKEKIFRVGHIGDLCIDDNRQLIKALNDLVRRGILK